MKLKLSRRARACGYLSFGILTATSVISAMSAGLALEAQDVHASTSTSGAQESAAIARDADGDFVVVWSGSGDLPQLDASGIYFQRFDAHGAAQGEETRANTTMTGIQRNPAVAMDASGNFVVAWETCDTGGATCDVAMQRFSSAGVAQGSQTTVNTTTADEQTRPAVARAAGGAFIVAWQSLNQDGSGQGIYAQRFAADGSTAGAEFPVNATTAFSQIDPAVAIDVSGNFVVSWTSGDGAGQLNGVFARRFAADGTPGSEFRANVDTAGDQTASSVGMSAAGAFTIAWEGPDADGDGVFMRRYDSSGTALTAADEPVNATTTGNQVTPAIAVDASGDIIVGWAGVDADPFGVFFQRFDASGVPQGAETPANATTTGDQAYPAVAADADGDAVVAWQSFGQDGGDYGIYLRRFSGPEAVDLSIVKTDSADPVANAGPYSYALTVTNNHAAFSGSGDATIDAAVGTATGITVEDVLPAGVGFVGGSSSDPAWNCSNAGQTVTCEYGDVLAPGATTSATVSVTAPVGGGEIDNTATVSGDQYDAVAANDAESEITYACATANAGTLQFSAATYTVGEDGDDAGGNDDGLATITVTRTGGSCGSASVEVEAASGSATAGADYAALAAPTTLSWTDGESAAKTFTIAITDELAHETDVESFTLALVNAERAALGNQDSATVSITDNDTPPVVTLSVTGSPFAENGGTATVTATLSKPAGRAVQVNLAYAAGPGPDATGAANRGTGCGTATDPSDYVCSGTTIAIAAGASTGSVTLTGVDDVRDEDDLEAAAITATCRLPNGQSEKDCDDAAAPTTSPQVQDDDAVPTVQFSAASSSVSEARPLPTVDRTTTLTLQLSAASDRPVGVGFTSAGTAVKATDFTLAPDSPGSFTFDPSQVSKTITVTVIHDTVDEPDETVVVTLASPTNATLGANTSHTLTITDDDATPTVQFLADPNPNCPVGSTAQKCVTEGSANPLTVTATVQLSGASSQTVTVPFTVGGTAANPQDHDAQAGTLTFVPGGSLEQSYTYTVANDALDEADETVVLTLGTPTGATASGNTTHTASVADEDPLPSVQIDTASSTSSASEAAGTASIVVSLTPQSGRTATVAYTLTGTATNGADYTVSPASPLTFATGETSKTVTVTLINDANNETNSESLNLNLGSPGNATLGTPATHTLTITDDDDIPQVHFSAAAQAASEGATGLLATLQLSRTTNVDVTVPFTTGGAASANDYTLLCPDGVGGTQACAGEVVIPAGQASASITINTTEDARVEANETLMLTIGTPLNATKDAPDQHTLTIQNDDAAGVAVNPLTADVIEGSGNDTYALVLTSEPANDVTVTLTVGAQAAVSPTSVTFTPANWSTPKTITVVAIDDALLEGAHTDLVTHAVDSVDLDYQGLAVDDVTVNVTDNDVPAIALTESGGSTDVTEGGATDTYSFVLTTQPTADVIITVTAGAQVARSPATITFTAADWNVPKSVTVTADDDLVDEALHTGTITHSVASGDGSYDGMAVRDVTANVTDNDTAGVTLTESAGATAVAEGGATDTYTIVLDTQPAADVTVSLAVGPDISVNPASVTFTAVNWNLGRSVTVTAADDDLAEGPEGDSVAHAVTSADPFYEGLAVAGVAVAVTDNDTVGLVVVESAGGTAVTEGGASDTFTVALSSQPFADVTIDVAADPQLAATPATLTFTPANFATPQTVTVSAADDDSAEAAHSGTVGLASNSTDAGYAGLGAVIAVAITDNDQVTGGEDAPGVVVTVTGGTVNVGSNQSQGGGGALSHGALLGLLGLLAVRRRRMLQAAALAALGLGAGGASAAELSYEYADLRYISADADPDVSVSAFNLAGSILVEPTVFLSGSYAIADTDDFRVQGVEGSVKSSSLSLGGGLRKVFEPGLDGTLGLSVVRAESEGEGGFAGSTSDTGYALEAGLRGWFTAKAEWGAALNYLSIFDDGSTSLNAQWLYHATPRFALALGAGASDETTQFNLGARFGF